MPVRLSPRLAAGAGLAIACALYSMNWWYTGPVYLLIHLVAVGGMAALSRALSRGPTDGLARALNVMALVLPLMSLGGEVGDGAWDMVREALRPTWFVWFPLGFVAVLSLWRRRRRLALLGRLEAAATCASVTTAPAIVIVGADAVSVEFMHAGLAMLAVYPAVVAAFATAWAWVTGRPSPSGRPLRRIASALAAVGIVLATVASAMTPGRLLLRGAGLLSLSHLGWAWALVALSLHFARDGILSTPDADLRGRVG